MDQVHRVFLLAWLLVAAGAGAGTSGAEHRTSAWPQYQHDSRHSGNAPAVSVSPPLHLVAAIPTTDAIFASPAIANGRIYVLDGSGVLHCVELASGKPIWRFASGGGPFNCNNYSSPAVCGDFIHFGTMAGTYYVLRGDTGEVVRRIECGEPIFSCPVVVENRVYFATLGARVYSLTADGRTCWSWDYLVEVLRFRGNRWSGKDWLRHQQGKRVTWREQFLCSRNMAAHGKRLVVPAGGSVLWLEDLGDSAQLVARFVPRESPATLGLSLDDQGTVYRQWFRRDNTGSVETLRLADGRIHRNQVPGTLTGWKGRDSMAFAPVAIRETAVFRTRPEQSHGLCQHVAGKTTVLGRFPSIAPPVLTKRHAIVSGLDGSLHIVDLNDPEKAWSFATPFGKPVTSPAAVADGHVVFGGEDGYLYILGPSGTASLPTRDLELHRIRSPLSTSRTNDQDAWKAHFANQANTNRSHQGVRPPVKMRWIRRCQGTIKHLSTFGGGRMYTHTAEGQVMAVEQETGRLLWRRFFPGVHVSFTTPAYHDGLLLVPQAGLGGGYLRCLDAATGKVRWEAPISGSPSWNRQVTPIVHDGLVFYQFSTGKYSPSFWLFEHQSTFGFPRDHKPLVRAWDLKTGEVKWTRDFSQYGAGGDDAGMCLANGTLYYSCYFGNRQPAGVTAALDPHTGKIHWLTTKYAVHAGCTPVVADGHLYLGGYNAVDGKQNYVWCLDAANGELVWKSSPVKRAIHTITVADGKLFTHAQYEHGYLLDAQTGKQICELTHGYRCTRFTMDGHYLLGPNIDMIDTARDNRLVSTGPPIDVLQCVGAQASNGRLFYTANGSGLQLSLSFGDEAQGQRPGP